MTTRAFSQLLAEHRDAIVALFVAEVERTAVSPPGVGRSLLVDHIPKFLDEIAAELARADGVRVSQEAIDRSASARRHGEQRWTLGYDLEAVIREYGVLRHCVLGAVKEEGIALSVDEFDVLAKCLSVGVAEAAGEYIKYRDQQVNTQKANLEFLAEAGQLVSSSLDYRSTLNRLTGLIVPRLADWCAVHVEGDSAREMPLAHVDPAKLEPLREIFQRFPLASDATQGYAHVIRTGEAQWVRDAESNLESVAESPEHRGLLRRIGTCSWMVVPLRVHDNNFGALALAYSDSGRHYAEEDLVLATELARRAAVAIDNARLFDLSQRERSRVEAATRAKDEFVAMISHELRTPLNAILGWTRLMRGASFPESKRDHALEVVERNANAQSRLVADLLDVSRAITGKIRINPAQVHLANLVDLSIEGVRHAIEAKRLELELDLDRANASMRGDADRLQQVVWNLLTNAVKFTPRNGKVSVRLRRVGADLELEVSDTGEGISPAFLPHVFESFRQSEAGTSRAHGGLGIGLTIAKHIVELHGGSIEARSPGTGQGATFAIRLPVSPLIPAAPGAPRVSATTSPVDLSAPGDLTGIRVLVVDDEADARELIAYVFECCQMSVRMAESVEDAMAQLETFTPHVVVSDIGMSDEDGYALIRRLRTLAAEDKKNIPAIALTAFARNEDRTRALVAGFNVHLSKPVEPSALLSAVFDLAGSAAR